MRRKELLVFLNKQLEKLGATFPVYEVYLPQGFKNISALRTLLIATAPSIEEIIRLFGRFTTDPMQTSWFARYDSSNDLLTSKLIPDNAADLGLNWRGRLWNWNDIDDIQTEEEFNEKILASYWRFLVTQRETEYFARYEISPSYYSPGHSTPGFSDFKDQIGSFLDFLAFKKERWQVDTEYDRIVCFSRKEPSKTFVRCLPGFFNGQNYVSYQQLEDRITQNGKEDVVDQIHTAILQSFDN